MDSDAESKRSSPPPHAPDASAGSVRVWVRFGEHDLELMQGESVVGRSPKCRIVLEDPLVSRSHARFVVNGPAVTIEDMKSANGVLVNGEQLLRARVLASGDRVSIGQQTIQLFIQRVDREARAPRAQARTLTSLPVSREESSQTMDSERSESTRKGDALELLIGVAEKVLALGRGEEAERILSSYLRNMLQAAKSRGELDPVLAEKAVNYAVRIAQATGKGAWVDFAFELYTVVRRPLPAQALERLYESLRKMTPVSASVYRQYLSVLRGLESEFGPAERFLLRRLEGLEALGALK